MIGIKILQISDYYHTGDGHPLNNISERLKTRGHDVIVYTSTLSALPTVQEENDTVKIIRFKGFKFAGKAIYPGAILKLLLQENPDVIHSHVVGFFSTFVAGYLKKIKKYPLVVSADFDVAEPRASLLKKPYMWLFREIPARSADIILTFTEREKEGFSKRFGVDKEKIEVLPIGIDYDKFSSKSKIALREKLGLEDKLVILNVSYVVPKKNLDVIIKAVKAVADDRVIFLHIGNVSDRDYKKSLDILIGKLGLGDRVLFLENIPREGIYDYYKISDIFIQPGYRESFCIPILEAMASSLPVITPNVGIASEVIKNGQTGFIISKENDIAAKIELLADNPGLRKKMGENCGKIAKEYDWEIIINKLEKIYERVMGD